MSSNEQTIWINGSLRSAGDAAVSVCDDGFTVGDGVFETLRVYDGEPFAVTRHWNRLKSSCDFLCIPFPSLDVFSHAMKETAAANGLSNARVRFTVSSGEKEPHASQAARKPTMTAQASALPTRTASERVEVSPWVRNERGALTGIKSTSYGENVVALKHARQQGAGEAVLSNTRGECCEGTTSNVFMVLDGECHTPPLSSGCLPGVTRALVIELGEAHGIPIKQSALPIERLSESQEAFLTSSLREVHPISHINGKPLCQTAGPLSLQLAELYKRLVRDTPDP